MDFGHDELFYVMMREAAAEHAREFPNCAAYIRHIRNGATSSRDYRTRLDEYRDCVRHAEEVERHGIRRMKKSPFAKGHPHSKRTAQS
jgi:hypothetical protein